MKKKAASSEAAFALSNQILRYGDAPASEGKGATRASAAIQRIAVGREEGEDNAPRDLINAATGIESVVHASAAIRREGKRPVNGTGFQRPCGPGFPHAQLAAEGDTLPSWPESITATELSLCNVMTEFDAKAPWASVMVMRKVPAGGLAAAAFWGLTAAQPK